MKENKFYITTTLPYVNSDPHIGFALEMVQADVIARYHKDVLGEEIFFNTGTDEHGLKIFRKAKEEGKDIQAYVDQYADRFKQLVPALGIIDGLHFIRTTEKHHISAAQEFWRRCFEKGDIYKKIYKVKYCVGCELEKTESDLNEQGQCLIHPHLKIELIEEENYFFRFSRYEKPLLDFYASRPDFVVPDFRFNEIKQFVKSGLQDFSISRLKEKMSWGVPVPDDESHVMYVWFDALINYVSTLGWPEVSDQQTGKSANQFQQFWGTIEKPNAIQIAGKDNLRQQSSMWQAMLMSAGLPNTKQIVIHGFINSGGQKMSKSLGNVADPYAILDLLEQKGLTKQQATDALRYYLVREISTFEDGDYTWEKFVESYNAGLANGIGNLTARILTMAVKNQVAFSFEELKKSAGTDDEAEQYKLLMSGYELNRAMDLTWARVKLCDVFIQENKPFTTIKTDPEKAKNDIKSLLVALYLITQRLEVFLPHTAKQIIEALKQPKEESIPRLFPRIE